MVFGRWTDWEIRCALLWRFARSYGWASWIPEDELVRAVPSHERGRARTVVDGICADRLAVRRPGRGFKIAHEAIETLALELRDECDFSESNIETTLSHFGGFG